MSSPLELIITVLDEETETKRLGILPQVSQNGLLKGLTASFLLDLSH